MCTPFQVIWKYVEMGHVVRLCRWNWHWHHHFTPEFLFSRAPAFQSPLADVILFRARTYTKLRLLLTSPLHSGITLLAGLGFFIFSCWLHPSPDPDLCKTGTGAVVIPEHFILGLRLLSKCEPYPVVMSSLNPRNISLACPELFTSLCWPHLSRNPVPIKIYTLSLSWHHFYTSSP